MQLLSGVRASLPSHRAPAWDQDAPGTRAGADPQTAVTPVTRMTPDSSPRMQSLRQKFKEANERKKSQHPWHR